MNSRQRFRSASGGSGLVGYSLLSGLAATAVGAAASLLVGGGTVLRIAVWLAVLALVALAGAWWWVRDPVTARRRTLGLVARSAGREALPGGPGRRRR
ncbi:hypothetical protein SAMN05421773_10652 [Streptomyces aidingensis]|uniref:Uncharacterized protein n=1 Tax=Streptomyces aidingensis TaxID=910347 RepID=A0A1I1M1T0_9ACTN|nr:hypothetical protein SAMN05421773_10652 [Streptomyces aidingensis]